jgi:hypothetical protein
MWNSCAKFSRLKKAFERHGLDPKALDLNAAAKLLKKRGITDTVQNRMASELIHLLEPPPCYMSHCGHFGGQSYFCQCSLERVPGHCPIYRDFSKRKKEREENPTTELQKIQYVIKNITPKLNGWGKETQKEKITEWLNTSGISLDEAVAFHKESIETKTTLLEIIASKKG